MEAAAQVVEGAEAEVAHHTKRVATNKAQNKPLKRARKNLMKRRTMTPAGSLHGLPAVGLAL